MSKESLLKKEFKEKDVNRVRNLVKKDYSGKTISSTGYTKVKTFYSEGDIWEENGRMWTIKNGIKQNITKLNSAKQAVKVPLKCPKCNGSMKHWLAKKMFKIHGFCFNCTVEYEAELRRAGLYKEYEQAMIKGGIKAFTKDLEQWVLNKLDENSTFVTEQGDIESWNNNSKKVEEKILEKLGEYTSYINSSLSK